MRFLFNGTYSNEEKVSFEVAQMADLADICRYLRTSNSKIKQISYNVYDTRQGKQVNDPNLSISRASARFEENAIYRYWEHGEDPHFPHEITHLVAHTWGSPYEFETDLDTWDSKVIHKKLLLVSTSFMQEGLAIAVDDIVFNRPLKEGANLKMIDDWCKDNLNDLPTNIESVINLAGFSTYSNYIVVPFAASFSKFLLTNYGIEKYKEMYCSIKEIYTDKENAEIFDSVYKASNESLIADWKQML